MTAVDPFTDPALSGRRMLATVYLGLIYVIVTPIVGGLLAWAIDRAVTSRPRPMFDFGAHPGFWLMITFVVGAPVLAAAAIAHFVVRRKAPLPAFGVVAGVGVVGWSIMALALEAQRLPPIVGAGLLGVSMAFPLARWAYSRTVFGALPPPPESAKPQA